MLGKRTASPSRLSRTKHLGFLDLEQPPGVPAKLAQLRPFPAVRASGRRVARALVPVHGVNAGLQPVVLGAQADEGCCLQAARVEAWLPPRRGRRGVLAPSCGEGIDLPFDCANKPSAEAHGQDGEPREAKRQSLSEPMADAARPWADPSEAARAGAERRNRYLACASAKPGQDDPKPGSHPQRESKERGRGPGDAAGNEANKPAAERVSRRPDPVPAEIECFAESGEARTHRSKHGDAGSRYQQEQP